MDNSILMKKTFLPFLLLFLATGFAQVYKTDTDISYYPAGTKQDDYMKERCKLDIYYPDTKNFQTVIWLHGGGITGGSKEIPEQLRNKGIAVIGVGYRLSPKVKAPSYIEDTAAAIAWVFKNIGRYGGDTSQIYISGHSAGGYLGLMAVMDKKWLAKYNIDANLVAGLIPFSAQCITHFTIRKERGIPETQPVVDEYAPLFHVRKDLPPLLLITGDRELELLGRYEENAYLARMMKLNGHTQTRLIELGGYDHIMTAPAFPLLLKEIKRIAALKETK